jgi:isoamylase
MFNASPKTLEFVVPVNHGRQWQVVVDTARPSGLERGTGAKVEAGDRLSLVDRSMMVLQRPA